MRVITYGTFDLFHYGHLSLLTRAADLGHELLVGISTDEFNQDKGKQAHQDYDVRGGQVLSIRCVTGIFPEDSWDQKREDITDFSADILVMGSDWRGKFDDLGDICKVVYLPRTEIISSSAIRDSLLSKQPQGNGAHGLS